MKKFRVFSKSSPMHTEMSAPSLEVLLVALKGTDVEAIYDGSTRVWQSWED